MTVGLLHALERGLDRGVAPRQAAGELALQLDPARHARGDRFYAALCQHFRRGAYAFDGNQLAYVLRKDAGVAQRAVPAELGCHGGRWRQLLLMAKLADISDVSPP